MYTISRPNAEAKSYARLHDAKRFATKVAVREVAEVEVVNSEDNTVAFVATHVQGRYFHPWERIENPTFAAPHFAGFYPAYTRKRIQATVYRSYDGEAVNPWRVHDGRTGGHMDVANTKAACALTKAMRLGQTL